MKTNSPAHNPRFAAVIPAAGFSSRMGFFKPLLPLGNLLLIERTVNTFKQAGIADIRVVTGYKRELLEPVLNRLGVQAFHNPDFSEGMYSSVKIGVRSLGDDVDAFFLMPADCPLVERGSVMELTAAYRRKPSDVIYPVHRGRRGHPPLISARLRSLIENSNPEDGLKSLLEKTAGEFREIVVKDPNIHTDFDTTRDCSHFSGNGSLRFPSESECMSMLWNAGVEPQVVHHSKEVARVAVLISEHLNSRGRLINLGIIMAAGLLHDIARDKSDHARKGREVVSALGYEDVGRIIASHMDIPSPLSNTINEASIIYLADKMVQGSRAVTVEERFSRALDRYGLDAAIENNIRERFKNALTIRKNIEKSLDCQVEDLVRENRMDNVPCITERFT